MPFKCFWLANNLIDKTIKSKIEKIKHYLIVITFLISSSINYIHTYVDLDHLYAFSQRALCLFEAAPIMKIHTNVELTLSHYNSPSCIHLYTVA